MIGWIQEAAIAAIVCYAVFLIALALLRKKIEPVKRAGMSPLGFFALTMVTIVALVAMYELPFIDDLVSASGYPAYEVFAGILAILIVFYSVIFALTVGN